MEKTVGEIRLFAGDCVPVTRPGDWLVCDGAAQSIEKNPPLYSVLGTMYGGDGKATFALPSLDPPADAPQNTMRYIICAQGDYPSRADPPSSTHYRQVTSGPMEGILGEIRLFAGRFAPEDWLFCDGAGLSIQGNQDLYSVLGSMYGGDGTATFALPKLAAPTVAPQSTMRFIICVKGIILPRD